ncbi:MAG TPA: hypothetical protein EYQ27_20745 [Gemmatimonadetes bacterium]|nr:hypothetical protein [Gemmatimonadota bacterium]
MESARIQPHRAPQGPWSDGQALLLPDGKAPHDKESVFLFPNTGVMYHAAQMDGIILSESWVIGDGALELASGWRAGCRLACIGDGSALSESDLKVEPEVQAMSLSQALSEIGAGVHTGR